MLGNHWRHPGYACRRLIHHPGAECLHTLLEPGELGDFRGLAVADHDIRLMTDDGLHQLADGRARVLVVAIGVHHDVGTMLERVIHAIAERTGQAHRLGMVDHVLHTKDRATSTVLSEQPSSMISSWMSSMPGISLGMCSSTKGRVFSSLRHGICMKRRIGRTSPFMVIVRIIQLL